MWPEIIRAIVHVLTVERGRTQAWSGTTIRTAAAVLLRFGLTCRRMHEVVEADPFWRDAARIMATESSRWSLFAAQECPWFSKPMREAINRGPTLLDESTAGRWYRCAVGTAFSNHGELRLPSLKPAVKSTALDKSIVVSRDGANQYHISALTRCLCDHALPEDYVLMALPCAWSLQRFSQTVRRRRRLERQRRVLLGLMGSLEPPRTDRPKCASAHLNLGAVATNALLNARVRTEYDRWKIDARDEGLAAGTPGGIKRRRSPSTGDEAIGPPPTKRPRTGSP
jgi:hypothetical protein